MTEFFLFFAPVAKAEGADTYLVAYSRNFFDLIEPYLLPSQKIRPTAEFFALVAKAENVVTYIYA